jgi:beta-fructofuranosidase
MESLLMTLHLPDKWLWDYWFAADDSPDYHIFYLQAPRDLAHSDLRHWHVSIGHATSPDLVNWTVLPDALAPDTESPDAFDNYTTWTGSILRQGDQWYLFYTGSNRAEQGLVQRIGLATSPDLLTWTKYPANPVLTADPRWYEQLDLSLWHDQAWRDPWVFEHEGQFHAYITARGLEGEPSARGVIGHAVSDDLKQWECRPPIAHPGEFGHMEVPQLVEIEGRWYLFFSVSYGQYAQARRRRPTTAAVSGTHYLISDHPLGPFTMIDDTFLLGDERRSRYIGKAIQNPAGEWVLMSSFFYDDDGEFRGDLADPLPLRVAANGRLSVSLP